MTQFITEWSRPTIITEFAKDSKGKINKDTSGNRIRITREDLTTREFYKNLINFRDGKEKADEYMKKHPRAKFNL